MTYNNATDLLKGIKQNLKEEKRKWKEKNIPESKFPLEVIRTHKIDNEVVGLIYGFIDSDIFYIDEVFVNEEHRTHGIATQLLKEVIEIANENGCYCVYIYLLPYNGTYMLESILLKHHFEFLKFIGSYKTFLLELH